MTYHNHGDESGNNETNINGEVSEPDEPPVTCASLQFTGTL